MGEPTAEAATSVRDVLLATKLNVPGSRPDLVPRPRLAQRLDEGRGQGLVLACAPAGYGKTVLLANWVGRPTSRGVAVAGCWRQRPGPVLAAYGGRAGPGAAGNQRADGPAAWASPATVVRACGDGADQRGSRPA